MLSPTTINVVATETLAVQDESHVLALTKTIRQQAAHMNLLSQTKLITAASELARNMLNYAGGGVARIEQIRQGMKTGIRLTFSDQGPGIADIDLAMQDGYSSGAGLGLGLPGARRLMDEFSLTSVVNQGTSVAIILWRND